MPHQCVRCDKFYESSKKEILEGCSCGSKLFFFVKKEKLDKFKALTTNLSHSDKKQIEMDVFDILDDEKSSDPVVLDLESIRVLKPGKFEIDVVHLMKKDPVVYKLEEGKYVVDILKSFNKES